MAAANGMPIPSPTLRARVSASDSDPVTLCLEAAASSPTVAVVVAVYGAARVVVELLSVEALAPFVLASLLWEEDKGAEADDVDGTTELALDWLGGEERRFPLSSSHRPFPLLQH